MLIPAAERKNSKQCKCPSAGDESDELYVCSKMCSTGKVKRLELQTSTQMNLGDSGDRTVVEDALWKE